MPAMALDPDEPVSLADAKAFCRVDGNDDDATLELLVVAARQYVEGRIGQALKPRTVTDVFDDFAKPLTLSVWPVDAASVSVGYVDADGADQDFAEFEVKASIRPAKIILASGAAWPAVTKQGQAVSISYDAGYDPYIEVPYPIRLAILMIVAARFDNRAGFLGIRSTEEPLGVEELLRRFRPLAVA
jgi:uncharacterized phiE125 gp8 family phage protein